MIKIKIKKEKEINKNKSHRRSIIDDNKPSFTLRIEN